MPGTHPPIDAWRPLELSAIADTLGGFDHWCLGGGRSLDLLVGRDTRDHGDVDIGVLRSELGECLDLIDRERVFLCSPLRVWNGLVVPREVHGMWVTDESRKHWVLEIMIYDEDGDEVLYRRHPRVRWRKDLHTIQVGDLRVLNPLVTILFKCHGRELADKDALDIRLLIEETGPALFRSVSN